MELFLSRAPRIESTRGGRDGIGDETEEQWGCFARGEKTFEVGRVVSRLALKRGSDICVPFLRRLPLTTVAQESEGESSADWTVLTADEEDCRQPPGSKLARLECSAVFRSRSSWIRDSMDRSSDCSSATSESGAMFTVKIRKTTTSEEDGKRNSSVWSAVTEQLDGKGTKLTGRGSLQSLQR